MDWSVPAGPRYYGPVVYVPVMDRLLVDEPIAILEGVALMAVAIGLVLASLGRGRSANATSQVLKVFWRDASDAGYVWSAATMVLLAGALLQVEGVRTPVWLLLAVAAGGVSLALARVRWQRERLGTATPDDVTRPDRPAVVSTTWEVGLLGAAAGALGVYIVSVSHSWGHPVHWAVALIGGALGYAVALMLATPRYTVRARRA